MILTGKMIAAAVATGAIQLEPFTPSQINPNSYNYRLGRTLRKADVDSRGRAVFLPVELGEDGYLLEPFTLYLGHTAESIGSWRYAMSLIGRSSMGRLGLFLQVSANLGHRGSAHRWTLEIYACQPVVVYPHMKIGQVSFWETRGQYVEYRRRYAHCNDPRESLGIPRLESLP